MSRILILGAGVSGLAAARLAASRDMSVTIYDADPSAEAYASGFGLAIGPWDHLLLTGVDLVVTSPGFPERSLPVVETLEAGLPIWSEIEFASSYLDVPLIAVTGTNGKTTVTEATSLMLEASGVDAPATGNIGDPLSNFVGTHHQALVVETSSFQLRFVEKFHPVAAAVTNVAADHLDWHGSASAYADAKRNIFVNQSESDLLVFDADDPGATDLVSSASSERYPVSGVRLPEGGGGVSDGTLSVGDVAISLEDLQLTDPVHLANLATSAALALWMGASGEAIESAAVKYRPGVHRRQEIANVDGIVWIDDSKATNPHAALASIRSHDSVVLIAGGLAKGTDVTVLGREPSLKAVFEIGESESGIAKTAGPIGHFVKTLERAVTEAAAVARPGDTVLLAPGCASFDQYTSYGARGDAFQALVGELQREVPTQ